MEISKKQFEAWVAEALDKIPSQFHEHMHNVVIFVQDYPDREQMRKLKIRRKDSLFGLYEGYHQASRIHVGTVLPDRITLFQKPITSVCKNEAEVKNHIASTLQHEIAHHFGSNEDGADKAGQRKF